ncbi:MAG TPA: GNAT family N-acetyltransferase [Drouetiella sp.]
MSELFCPEKLETGRLILRRWKDSDLELYSALNADPDVMEHFPSTLSLEDSEKSMGRIMAHFEKHHFGLWAVESKQASEFIGFIGLQNAPFEAHFTPCVEIGWRLSKQHWGYGYASEGARMALRDGFERLQLREIVAITTTENERSMRVMEKIGMTRNKDDDFDHPKIETGSRWCRHVLYRLQRQHWENS